MHPQSMTFPALVHPFARTLTALVNVLNGMIFVLEHHHSRMMSALVHPHSITLSTLVIPFARTLTALVYTVIRMMFELVHPHSITLP